MKTIAWNDVELRQGWEDVGPVPKDQEAAALRLAALLRNPHGDTGETDAAIAYYFASQVMSDACRAGSGWVSIPNPYGIKIEARTAGQRARHSSEKRRYRCFVRLA